MQDITIADLEIKATTGLFDPSLGAKQSQQSGKAIQSLQRKGDISTFAFVDNLGRAMTFMGKLLVDLIPKVYDTDRIIRVIAPDEKPTIVRINEMLGPDPFNPDKPAIRNNLAKGKYDVTVSIGPSYATQRLESADRMIKFLQILPKEMAVRVMDLIADADDWPGKEKFIKRIKSLLPPELQDEEEHPGQPGPTKPLNPAQQQQMMQMQMQMQKAQLDMKEQEAKIQKLLAQVQEIVVKTQETKVKTQHEIVDIGKEHAKIKAGMIE